MALMREILAAVPGLMPDHPYPKLASLRSYEDPRSGIQEAFIAPMLGGARTVAVLSGPLGDAAPMAWVMCPAFAVEQNTLQPLEASLARAMAAAGFTVLRYHSQGYGDSELPADVVSPTTHIRDAADAVALLRTGGAERVGLVGCRFGGSVAALVADRIGADAAMMCEPIIKGRSYLDAMARRAIVSQLSIRATEAREDQTANDPLRELEESDTVDLQGFPLTRAAYDQMRQIDLTKDLTSFSGAALAIQISRSTTERPDIKRLVARLAEIGARPTHEVVTDPKPQNFGGPRYRASTGKKEKFDTQGGLTEALTGHMIAWSTRLTETAALEGRSR